MARQIEFTSTLDATVEDVRRLLRDHPERVFGEPLPDPRLLPAHRFEASIPVDLGSGASVEQAVVVDLGLVPGEPRVLSVEVSWEPTGRTHTLPAFGGALDVTPTPGHGSLLTLRGSYVVPLGALGRIGDVVVGHHVVDSSLSEFLTRLARRIDVAVDRERDGVAGKRHRHRPGTDRSVTTGGRTQGSSRGFEQPSRHVE